MVGMVMEHRKVYFYNKLNKPTPDCCVESNLVVV